MISQKILEILKNLFKSSALKPINPDHYAVRIFNTCSGDAFELDKRQYDYWLENQDKLNKYICDIYLPMVVLGGSKKQIERYKKMELSSSLDIPIWAKENSWSLIRSSGFSRPSLLHSKMLITKNGLDYANFSVKDFALDNDIKLSLSNTDSCHPSKVPVYLMQINMFSWSNYVYYFDTFHPLDLDKFSLSGAATDCGDYVITDLLYEDAIHPLKYYCTHSERNSVVPKIIKYDEIYPSTPEEALDLNCREISEASADGFKIQLQSI